MRENGICLIIALSSISTVFDYLLIHDELREIKERKNEGRVVFFGGREELESMIMFQRISHLMIVVFNVK